LSGNGEEAEEEVKRLKEKQAKKYHGTEDRQEKIRE
jgi:hypothetical protein